MSQRTVRVHIVDDSRTSRLLLRRLLEIEPGFVVVGESDNGKAAIEAIGALRPDVVLMDVVMPVMDGFTATRALMAERPLPILLVSDLVGRGADLNFEALQAGALDIIGKPSAEDLADPFRRGRLRRKIATLAEVPVVTRRVRSSPAQAEVPAPVESGILSPLLSRQVPNMVCMGASTGGPPALVEVLARARHHLPAPVLLVQHIAPGFTVGFVRWLADTTGLDVGVAESGMEPRRGQVLVAPDGRHMELLDGRIVLSDGPARRGHRPSVDTMFESVARSPLAPRSLAVLLTGMGQDGAAGLLALRQAGAWTIAQDETTSVVWGMPRVAAELGAARQVLPLQSIGDLFGRGLLVPAVPVGG